MDRKDLDSHEAYIRLIKAKANRIIKSYDEVKTSPLDRIKRFVKKKLKGK